MEIKFPAALSSTLLADWRACKHQFYLRNFLGLQPKGGSIHLWAGGCFAKGIEAARRAFYVEKLDQETAIARGWAAIAKAWGEDPRVPEDHLKALHRTQELLLGYFERWPLAQETLIPVQLGDTLGVECNFAVPLPILHPETGDPILFAGTFDMLAEENGIIFVNDEKTASQLGPTWASKWDLRSQFLAYVWGARTFGMQVKSVSVRGACFLKNGFSYAGTRVIFPEWMIDEWYEGMLEDVEEMIAAYRRLRDEGVKPRKVMSDPCHSYGGCSYKMLCLTPNPELFQDAYYQVEYYDPLSFHKE